MNVKKKGRKRREKERFIIVVLLWSWLRGARAES